MENNDPFNIDPFDLGDTKKPSDPTPASTPLASNVQPPRAKGKPFAIIAFALGIAAIAFCFTALLYKLSLHASEELADELTTSSTTYKVLNADFVITLAKTCFVLSIIFAVASAGVVVFAYLGYAQNVKNNIRSKLILIFSIIATITAFISLVISIVCLI